MINLPLVSSEMLECICGNDFEHNTGIITSLKDYNAGRKSSIKNPCYFNRTFIL